jgi:hypothetical protein
MTVGINANDQLSDVSALAHLTHLAESPNMSPDWSALVVMNNANLPQCSVWELEHKTGRRCGQSAGQDNWTSCSGNTGGGSCGSLPADFVCVPGAVGPGVYDGNLYISDTWQNANLNELGGLTCVTGNVSIFGQSQLTDLSQLSTLQLVGGSLSISNNAALTSVNGLEHLSSVGVSLNVTDNAQLGSLTALSNLIDLGNGPTSTPGQSTLLVVDNAGLPQCWVAEIEARTDQTCGQTDWQGTWTGCDGNQGGGTCSP